VSTPAEIDTTTRTPAARSARRWPGRLGVLCALDEVDDLAERGVGADLGRLVGERAGLVDRAADDLVADLLLHRDRLAGHEALVDRARAALDDAVDGDLVAGLEANDIADDDLRGRDLALVVVADHRGGRRDDVEQRAQTVARALRQIAEQLHAARR
jgi:hypothetical protein